MDINLKQIKMKKVLLLLVAIMMLSSCESNSGRAYRQNNPPPPPINPNSDLKTELVLGCLFVFKKSYTAGGLIHHPKCPNHKTTDSHE
jgi:hypothetical protein